MSAEIALGGRTRVSWAPSMGSPPVDPSPYATTIRMERVTDPAVSLMASGYFKPVVIRGRVALTPFGYRALLGRTHPRLRRMHSAYGNRGRGPGR